MPPEADTAPAADAACLTRDAGAEAEALLRALGEPLLEWHCFNGLRLSNRVLNRVDGYEEVYEVVPNHRETRFYSRCVRGNTVCSRSSGFVATEDDAKALCEHHLLSGEWE